MTMEYMCVNANPDTRDNCKEKKFEKVGLGFVTFRNYDNPVLSCLITNSLQPANDVAGR